jgi:hypothetical protein
VSVPGADREPHEAAADPHELERLRGSVQALHAQNATLRQLVAIHDRLGGLVLQGADVAAITSLLGDLVGRRVLLLDPLLAPVTVSGTTVSGEGHLGPSGSGSSASGLSGSGSPASAWAPSEAYVTRILSTLADDRRPLRVPPVAALGVEVGCVVTPIVVGDAIIGYLVILENGIDE